MPGTKFLDLVFPLFQKRNVIGILSSLYDILSGSGPIVKESGSTRKVAPALTQSRSLAYYFSDLIIRYFPSLLSNSSFRYTEGKPSPT